MAKQKVDYSELERIVSENPNVKIADLANILGVSKGTASKARKRLGYAFSKDVATRSAPALVDKKVSAMDYLLSLVEKVESDLRWIEESVPPRVTEEYRAWQDQKLKVVAEMRKLINTIGDIAYNLYHAKEVKEVLDLIIEEVRLESPECQRRIQQRIRARLDVQLPFDIPGT